MQHLQENTITFIFTINATNYGVKTRINLTSLLTFFRNLSLLWTATCLRSDLGDITDFSPPQDHNPQIPNPGSPQDPEGLPVGAAAQRGAVDGQDSVPFLYGAFLSCYTWGENPVNLKIRHNKWWKQQQQQQQQHTEAGERVLAHSDRLVLVYASCHTEAHPNPHLLMENHHLHCIIVLHTHRGIRLFFLKKKITTVEMKKIGKWCTML